ncbi:Hypothetical predicted protein [Paramuricea clavata]|uniref:Uncharacterized protein n=1 Tax=Paramuricea clavata TaxID=317549 RepID=A0A7D9D9H5_PARCT|nr:Hypothetical predicted protein [Paramuricea clavata]
MDNHERRVLDYVREKDFWLKGGFDTVRDFIAIDDETDEEDTVESDNPATPKRVWKKNPTHASVGIDGESGKEFYRIPVEWVSRLYVNDDGFFVLKPYEFCCREVLVRSSTQLVRCQSLTISQKYYCDEHFFHVGSGKCIENSNAETQVFAATHLYVGLKSIMRMFETGLYCNTGEMLCALEKQDDRLSYYVKEVKYSEKTVTVIYTKIMKKGTFIRNYLAHILVCKKCNRYLADFLTLLDQAVEDHPCPEYKELTCDGYNHLGLPIYSHILDADFDNLNAKAYYGVIDGELEEPCAYVDFFMNTYVKKYV